MKFRVGEKIWAMFDRHEYCGKRAGVVIGVIEADRCTHPMCGLRGIAHYEIDVPECVAPDKTNIWHAKEKDLRPRFDDYDGRKIVSWDDCPWQPEKVT